MAWNIFLSKVLKNISVPDDVRTGHLRNRSQSVTLSQSSRFTVLLNNITDLSDHAQGELSLRFFIAVLKIWSKSPSKNSMNTTSLSDRQQSTYSCSFISHDKIQILYKYEFLTCKICDNVTDMFMVTTNVIQNCKCSVSYYGPHREQSKIYEIQSILLPICMVSVTVKARDFCKRFKSSFTIYLFANTVS
jgi:hypothetical protein